MRYSLVAVVAGLLMVGCGTSGLSPSPRTAADDVGSTTHLTNASVRPDAKATAVDRPDTDVYRPELQTWGAPDDDEDYGF